MDETSVTEVILVVAGVEANETSVGMNWPRPVDVKTPIADGMLAISKVEASAAVAVEVTVGIGKIWIESVAIVPMTTTIGRLVALASDGWGTFEVVGSIEAFSEYVQRFGFRFGVEENGLINGKLIVVGNDGLVSWGHDLEDSPGKDADAACPF